MAKIKVEKDNLRTAMGTYDTAISTLETAINEYRELVSVMESNKSKYCKKMGKAMETAVDDHGKDILRGAKAFSTEVKSFVDNFEDTDEYLAHKVLENNPMHGEK